MKEFLTIKNYFTQTSGLDKLQKIIVDDHKADKLNIRQLQNVDEVEVFRTNAIYKSHKTSILIYHIGLYNPHKKFESFRNKVKEIRRDILRQSTEF